MGTDASNSVVDSWGRTHEHENLFVVGAPTIVSSSSANGTLTFCALALRSAERLVADIGGRKATDAGTRRPEAGAT
jgi:quinoprotein glucose dehydrogenase